MVSKEIVGFPKEILRKYLRMSCYMKIVSWEIVGVY